MRPGFLELLAQARSGRDTGDVVVWVGVLLAVVIVGGIVLMVLRRRMLSADAADQGGGFMDTLREMRNSGQMSQEEYDAARKTMAARLAGDPSVRGTANVKTQRRGESE